MQHDNGVLICSAFHTRAELRGSLSDVRNAMKSVPNVKRASTGTIMRYSIRETGSHKPREAILELAPKEITLTFYFKEPNTAEYKHNLLQFMSILAYLKDFYNVSMGDIYGYVIVALRHEDYALAREAENAANPPNERIDALNSVNVSLSHELSLKNGRIKTIDGQLTSYRSFSKEVIQKLMARSGSMHTNALEALNAFGIDGNLASEIVSSTSEDTSAGKKGGEHG